MLLWFVRYAKSKALRWISVSEQWSFEMITCPDRIHDPLAYTDSN